ncbi:MAG: TadE/TadG family type IV pilus assembly protein [Gemmatimonadota bacterium]
MTLFRRPRLMRRFGRERDGAAMVEFAIIAPLLFVLIFGIIDFGRAFFLYNNLTNAAREGARLGAVLDAINIPEATRRTQIQAHVRSKINDDPVRVAASTVTVTFPGSAPAQTARVQIVNYPFVPVTFLAIKASKTLNVTAEFRLEFQ